MYDAVTQGVLASVADCLLQVVGDELELEEPITMETRFNEDLELESIEFVSLAEALQQRYNDVDFVSWISSKELDEIIELRVGDLVKHIVACRS